MSALLDENAFQTVRSLIGQHAGIELNPSKRQMASNRLSRPMRKLGLTQLSDYVDLVEKESSQIESFVNAMTTNVTSFFREAHHFPILTEHIRQDPAAARVWSAGCSTGQEPYSIVFTLVRAYPCLLEQSSAIVIATDIDTHALTKAKTGIYSKDDVQALHPGMLSRNFDVISESQVQVKPEFRRLIEFKPFNLAAKGANLRWQALDAVFCRNVMIYFNATTQRQLVDYFSRVLKPNGRLFTGHSEMLLHSENLFQSLGQTTFRLRRSI
jgi:chemotaxis protein methyltransferase CheR